MTAIGKKLQTALNKAKRSTKAVLVGKWEVRKTIWPYAEGYGTYHTGKKMVLDTGLTKIRAQELCDKLNNGDSDA
jgi:hypothetical protein